MRFQRLQIPAFGPFTNFDLRFSDQPSDLHVIYGANEAGKSSLLRAMRDLLFGIHDRSTDNFLHDYGELRIKGEIRNRDGEQLTFQRRKGKKSTLLNKDGTPLPDDALVPFLGSIDQSYFSAMFGLGAIELREGAEQLLRGEGNIGNALFSASLGGTPVQKAIEALEEEANGLFKGRSTASVSIRPTVNRYKELLRQSRDAMVNPETCEKLEQDLAKAVAEKELFEDERTKLQLELGWIERCEDALPTVGRLSEESQKLAQLPPLPELASDFANRAQAARQAVGDAQADVHRLTTHIGKLRGQLAGCQTFPAVLTQADVLDQLHQDFGVYRNRKESRTDEQARLAGLEPLIRAGMDNLQIGGEFAALESHRLNIPVRLACEESASELAAALIKQTANSDKTDELETQITPQETQLQELLETDLTGLREALAVAAEATEADRTFSASESEVQRLTRETADKHRQVMGAPKDLEATARLSVPASATIRSYHERLAGINRELQNEQGKLLKANERIVDFQGELGRLQRQGELPSEEALRQAREHRDHGWSLVMAEWKGDGAKEELVPGSPLEVAFPLTIAQADGIADKLRLDAEAVAQAEEKRSQLRELEVQAGAGQNKILELQGNLDGCQKAWQAEWAGCGITPRSPLEMEEWRAQWGELRERLSKLRTAEESFQAKRNQIQQAKKHLGTVLGQSEEKEFSLLFATTKKLVQDGEQATGQRIELKKQLAGLKNEISKLEKSSVQLANAVNNSMEKWKQQCAAVSLPEGTSPHAGLVLLRERKDLLAKFDEWQELSSKSQTTIQAIAQYEKHVEQKAAALGITGDTNEALESGLWKLLSEARKSQERFDQLDEQVEEANNELEKAQSLVAKSEKTFKGLMELAGLNTAEELEPLLANLEKRHTVQAHIDNFRQTLGELARGQSVDEFVARVQSENVEELPSRKMKIESTQSEKKAALQAVQEALVGLNRQKHDLEKVGDAAADFRQQAESCAATLKQAAARFLRLRLATQFLQAQIEQFRKENQGPLLQKSGEVFQAITRGAFSGLGAMFNADDSPVLVGTRPDQSEVPVEGLSEGSRDQLYLALRLAALDGYLADHEPMPLILDDLLITFDDERAKAILPQLRNLANRTQIFLFTHHEHLVELCRQTVGIDQFHLHRFGNAS